METASEYLAGVAYVLAACCWTLALGLWGDRGSR